MSFRSVRIISFIVFLATLTVAILGFSLMGDSGHMMAGCFGTVPAGDCSILGLIRHFESHVHAFQSITGVIVGSIFALLVSLLIAALCLTEADFKGDLPGRFTIDRFLDSTTSYFVRFTRWLALHEKRDPSFAYATNT